MSYILKNTNKIVNTQITDVGRRKLSQGKFKIKYFQVGDSEIFYNIISGYNQSDSFVLQPQFNSQNDTGVPESNKANIKYPLYLDENLNNSYGLPYMSSDFDSVFENVSSRGFFTGSSGSWSAITQAGYLVTSNYYIDLSTVTGGTKITIISGFCNTTTPIVFTGCCDPITSTTTTTTTSTTTLGPCDLTGTTATTTCIITGNTREEGVPIVGDFVTIIFDCSADCGELDSYPILTYRICCILNDVFVLDREIPDLASLGYTGQAQLLIYPSEFTGFYDYETSEQYWNPETINFESSCDISNDYVKIWNMAIPWSESPAGIFSLKTKDVNYFASKNYLGSKEYFGYQTNSGQKFINSFGVTTTTDTFYYNSFDEQIYVEPRDQKAIAIIHYTNQGIDFEYGEKFATQELNVETSGTTGLAQNFKLDIPWLLWHKTTGNTIGETFYIDPPGYSGLNVCYMVTEKYDMVSQGMRYYHLWDLNPDSNGNLNRIGKVYPDSKMVVIDDEEIIAAMSYKSNRNWTLPAPNISLISPNLCQNYSSINEGLLTSNQEYLWLTYRFENTAFTNSLHCNYYSVIKGPDQECDPTQKNVVVRFGDEFPFLRTGTTCNTGFYAEKIIILAQKVIGNQRPSPTSWKEIDVTNQVSASTLSSGYLTVSSLTTTSFIIDKTQYDNGTTYNLDSYISLPDLNETSNCLNFGDEYYFYGNIETDIQSTIYQMKYVVNLTNNQFKISTNPTWSANTSPYITEIGLYDDDKDLVVISKLQSPQIREGIQQFAVSYIF